MAVQATTPGVAFPADDALLLRTDALDAVQVDVPARVARVEAGARWVRVLEKTAPDGRAPLLGSSPDVAAVGYTLGGGLGWLARRYGPAADSVRSFEVVTADGRRLRTDAAEHPDLFWGLRGGGREAWRWSPPWRSGSSPWTRCTAATCSTRPTWPGRWRPDTRSGSPTPPRS